MTGTRRPGRTGLSRNTIRKYLRSETVECGSADWGAQSGTRVRRVSEVISGPSGGNPDAERGPVNALTHRLITIATYTATFIADFCFHGLTDPRPTDRAMPARQALPLRRNKKHPQCPEPRALRRRAGKAHTNPAQPVRLDPEAVRRPRLRLMPAMPSLLTLRIFVVSARTLNLSRAAEALNLTQGAVSKHVKALEERMGSALFTRHARGLQLTEAGRAYLGGIQAGLAAIDEAEARVADLRKCGNRITLAVPPAVAAWVVPAIAAFMTQHPDLTVVMRPRIPSAQPGATAVPPDAEIRFGEGGWPGMRSRYLLGRETCMVGSPGLMASLGLTRPADLAARRVPVLRHILVPQAWPTWLAAMQVSPDAVEATIASEYEQYSTLLAAALAGLGAAVVPRFLAAEHLRAGSIVAPF